MPKTSKSKYKLKDPKQAPDIDVEVVKLKPGPESNFNADWMCEKIIEVARNGGHQAAMMLAIGVRSTDTFYRWLEQYPEFKNAYEYSKVVSKAFYEDIGLKGALGMIPGFNFHSYAMTMNNKFPEDYKRSATGGNTEITINTMNLSPDQLDSKIAQKLEQLKAFGVEMDVKALESHIDEE